MATVEKVIIVGSGPAGWTAGLYNARANMSPLLFAGTPKPPDVLPGGQLMTTTEVENYPGFENGIMGPDLMAIMRKQAERFGCRVVEKDVTNVDFTERPFRIWSGDIEYHTWTVIIATGARPRRLGIAGENDFFGRGVSSCAVCDGAFFRDNVRIRSKSASTERPVSNTSSTIPTFCGCMRSTATGWESVLYTKMAIQWSYIPSTEEHRPYPEGR